MHFLLSILITFFVAFPAIAAVDVTMGSGGGLAFNPPELTVNAGETVRFVNDMGMVDRRDYVGLWATSVQHQIDHLNGRMYFDNLSPVKRQMLLKKADKIRKRG